MTARNAIVLAVMTALLAVAISLAELMMPPDSDGLARDSFGTKTYGMRGLVETMEELNLPVSRNLSSLPNALRKDGTLLLWAPDPALVKQSKGYTKRIRNWVEEGNRLIVVPHDEEYYLRFINKDISGSKILSDLGLPSIQLEWEYNDKDKPEEHSRSRAVHPNIYFRIRNLETRISDSASYRVSTTGEAEPWLTQIVTLQLPTKKFRRMKVTEGDSSACQVLVHQEDRNPVPIAALFPVGKGEVWVVSEPSLFSNVMLDKADNAFLAINLLSRGSASITVDEFFHGLAIKSNPLWLLTRFPYGLIAACVMMVILLFIWQQAVRLGPIIPVRSADRRNIEEYLGAMARLFQRSGHFRFLLQELRSGVLWRIRTQLGLGPEKENIEEILPVLRNRDPEKALMLESCIRNLDSVCSSRKTINRQTYFKIGKEIDQCL